MTIIVSQTGVGTATHTASIRNSEGASNIPIQVSGDGSTTFKINARVYPAAPWVTVVSAGTADVLQALQWYPYLQVQVTLGSGTVTLYVEDQ